MTKMESLTFDSWIEIMMQSIMLRDIESQRSSRMGGKNELHFSI